MWPSDAEFGAAAPRDTQNLFIIPGSARDGTTSRIWFQETAVVFTKVCE